MHTCLSGSMDAKPPEWEDWPPLEAISVKSVSRGPEETAEGTTYSAPPPWGDWRSFRGWCCQSLRCLLLKFVCLVAEVIAAVESSSVVMG